MPGKWEQQGCRHSLLCKSVSITITPHQCTCGSVLPFFCSSMASLHPSLSVRYFSHAAPVRMPLLAQSYFVPRNANGNLPVYSDIRNNGTRYLVLIRGVDGKAQVNFFVSTLSPYLTHIPGSCAGTPYEPLQAFLRQAYKGRHRAWQKHRHHWKSREERGHRMVEDTGFLASSVCKYLVQCQVRHISL